MFVWLIWIYLEPKELAMITGTVEGAKLFQTSFVTIVF